jgi:large subunit ribosomal protein L13
MIKTNVIMDHQIDATNKRLGRLASEIATILQGKKDPAYAPNKVSGDRVILRNWEKVTIGGKKFKDKIYYRHTGYMGHLKSLTFEEAFTRDPRKVIRETVRHMLPKNFLNTRRLNNLVFAAGPAKDKEAE